MRTIESAVIFPITLLLMVSLILLSFSLHDMVLYKNASYKFLLCNNPNSKDYNDPDSDNVDVLVAYIYAHSLTNNPINITKEEYDITISTKEYNADVNCVFYDKCELLRKCNLAGQLINKMEE